MINLSEINKDKQYKYYYLLMKKKYQINGNMIKILINTLKNIVINIIYKIEIFYQNIIIILIN